MSRKKTSITSDKRWHASSRVLIDVDNIELNINGLEILKDINFCLHEGEFVGLIGPNGAGKTTLLKVILGLQPASSGQVNKAKTKIGYIPQQGAWRSSIIPISVAEVVGLQAGSESQKIESALEQVRMKEYVRADFSTLSGGQKQRVLIAKALVDSPEVLVLDEPTTGIDELSQAEFFEDLKLLHDRGLTIIMVSHDIDTVLNLVSRVICLNQTIVYDGPSEHFETDKYLPQVYGSRHRILHHHHGGKS